MQDNISCSLKHWQGIARTMAGKYNKPFKIVQPDMSHGYVVCAVDAKTSCEEVWNTDIPESIEQDIFQPESEPIVHKNEDKLHKLEMLQKKLQDKIDRLKGV